jgi:hypothetical protein
MGSARPELPCRGLLFGGGELHVRNDVFDLQVFVRLVKVQDLVAERGHPLPRGRVRDIGFNVYGRAPVPSFQSLHLGVKVLSGELDEPALDLSPGGRRVLEKLAVGAGQDGIHHIFRRELSGREVADGLEVAELVADDVIQVADVLTHQRKERSRLRCSGELEAGMSVIYPPGPRRGEHLYGAHDRSVQEQRKARRRPFSYRF